MDTSVVAEAAPPISPKQSHYMGSIQLVVQTRNRYNTVCLKNVKASDIMENLHMGRNKVLK
jgi:hypothetical protein